MIERAETERFVKVLFQQAAGYEGQAFVCSLVNGQGGERKLLTRDIGRLLEHAQRWDLVDRGGYICPNLLRPGERSRNKDAIGLIGAIHADTDFKTIGISQDEAMARVLALPCAPTMVVASGGGLHCYWLLADPLEATTDNVELVEQLNGLAADVLGGDTQARDVSRLLRLPGTHNTKNGEWKLVTIAHCDEARLHELDDLQDWLAVQSPVIHRITKAKDGSATSKAEPENPWLAAAKRLGFKPPIDVEEMLSAMSYQGGENSIHETQIRVSAALLGRGVETDEVVETLLEATKAAAGEFGSRWNWRREENNLRRMCADWLKKHPEILERRQQEQEAQPAQPAQPEQPNHFTQYAESVGEEEEPARANGTNGGSSAEVVSLAERRQKKESAKPKKVNKEDIVLVVAEGVLAALREQGHDLLLTEGALHIYDEGVWRIATPADEQWLRVLIQTGCEVLKEPIKATTLNGIWKRIMEHPALWRRRIEWDQGMRIVAQNVVVDLQARTALPFAPSHYVRRKIGVAFHDDAACPMFLRFLGGVLADKRPEEKEGIANLIQEFFGASLLPGFLSREQRKALIFVGPSRTGKTELAAIFRGMLGGEVAACSMAEISNPSFGLQSFYGVSAWVRDDAVNEGDQIDPQRFKTIITGELIEINRKQRDPIRIELKIPVLLTANSLPRARDSSDAIFNRSHIVDLTNVFDEEAADKARRDYGCPVGKSLGQHIIDEEGPGILAWAIVGLGRLLVRGRYAPTESIKEAVKRFHDDNNPVAAWARLAIERADGFKVAKKDILCAFNGWQRDELGDEARATGSSAFFRKMRRTIPWPDYEHQEHDGERFVVGLRLTKEGLSFWQQHHDAPLKNGQTGISATTDDVNRLVSNTRKEKDYGTKF